MPTGFFDLPREIRDEIYDHVWSSTPRIFLSYSPTVRVRARYGPPAPNVIDEVRVYVRPPQGIAASRSLLHESLSAFYRKGVVHFECGNIYKWRWGVKTLETDWARSGSTPIHITSLHLHLELSAKDDLQIQTTTEGEKLVTRKFKPDSISALRHLAEDYVRIGSPKEIRIDFRLFGATDAAIFTLRHKIDFAPLKFIGGIAHHIDSLEIVVKDLSRGEMAGQTMRKALCDGMEMVVGNATSEHMVTTVEKEPAVRWVELAGYTWRFSFTKE